MRKTGILFTTLFAGIFGLTSCDLDLGFIQFGKPNQVVKEDADQNPDQEPSGEQSNSNQSGDAGSQGSEDSGSSTTGTTLDQLKAFFTPLIASYYEMDASEITYSDYEGDDDDYAYYCISSDLEFVVAECLDETQDGQTLINYFAGILPSGFTFDNSISELDDDYADWGYVYYDYFYKNGTYYVDINVEDMSDDEGFYVYFSIFVFKQDQLDAFESYWSSNSSSSNGYDDYDDWDF